MPRLIRLYAYSHICAHLCSLVQNHAIKEIAEFENDRAICPLCCTNKYIMEQSNKNVNLYNKQILLTGSSFEPSHVIMVLIAYANSKDSTATAPPHSLTRAFVVHTRVVYDDSLDQNQTSSLTKWLRMRR